MSWLVLVPATLVLSNAAVVELLARHLGPTGAGAVRTLNAAMAALALALLLVPGVPAGLRAAAPLLTFVSVVVVLVAGARQARATPPQVPLRYAVSLEARPGPGAFVSWRLQAATLVLVLATVAALLLLHDALPARVPLHYDLHGRADRFGAPQELYALGVVPLSLLGLPWLAAWCAARERWALPAARAEEYAALQLERRTRLVRLTEQLTLVLVAGTCALWVGLVVFTAFWPKLGVLAVLPVLLTGGPGALITVSLGLGPLERLEARLRELAGGEVLGTRPGGWRAGGLVYWEREDPAVVVPRRVGLGWTFNLARPAAWALLALVTLLVPTLLVLAL